MLIKRLTLAAALASILLVAAPLQAHKAPVHGNKTTHSIHHATSSHTKAAHSKSKATSAKSSAHAKSAHAKSAKSKRRHAPHGKRALARRRTHHRGHATALAVHEVTSAPITDAMIPASSVYPLAPQASSEPVALVGSLVDQQSLGSFGEKTSLPMFASGDGPIRASLADRLDPTSAPELTSADTEATVDQDDIVGDDLRKTLVSLAMKLRDIRYVRGGHDPSTGFDCSGFVRYVFAHAVGLHLPTNSAGQFLAGLKVRRDDMQAGDLVFFRTGGRRHGISHVGIYLDNGRFIHSPSRGKSVEVSSLDEAYWSKRFAGARRPEGIAQS